MAFTNNQGRTQSSLSDINVTPLVDVVLVLLIIFMVTTTAIAEQGGQNGGLKVSLPRAGKRDRKSVV